LWGSEPLRRPQGGRHLALRISSKERRPHGVSGEQGPRAEGKGMRAIANHRSRPTPRLADLQERAEAAGVDIWRTQKKARREEDSGQGGSVTRSANGTYVLVALRLRCWAATRRKSRRKLAMSFGNQYTHRAADTRSASASSSSCCDGDGDSSARRSTGEPSIEPDRSVSQCCANSGENLSMIVESVGSAFAYCQAKHVPTEFMFGWTVAFQSAPQCKPAFSARRLQFEFHGIAGALSHFADAPCVIYVKQLIGMNIPCRHSATTETLTSADPAGAMTLE
jgi:hypothetical protein